MFLHTPRAPDQGQICIRGFMSKIWLWKKFLHFWNLYRKKPENIRFCVSIFSATNRLTFEKIPPSPPLLHPNSYWGENSRRQVMNVFSTGFWGNGCEQVLNCHLNAKALQSGQRPAPQADFFWGVGTKSYRVGERVRVTIQRFFTWYLTLQNAVFMWHHKFVW